MDALPAEHPAVGAAVELDHGGVVVVRALGAALLAEPQDGDDVGVFASLSAEGHQAIL